MPVRRDTLQNLLRALPDLPIGAVTVVGVDDFALRRGCIAEATGEPRSPPAKPNPSWPRKFEASKAVCAAVRRFLVGFQQVIGDVS